MPKLSFPPRRIFALWGGLLVSAFLFGAQPAHAACENRGTVIPTGFGEQTDGVQVWFSRAGGHPPGFCYEWRVSYGGFYGTVMGIQYGIINNDDGCEDYSTTSTNSIDIDWETLYAHAESEYSEPGDEGALRVRARGDFGACGKVDWGHWRKYTFTVPDHDE